MKHTYLLTGSLLAALAVILGALGAHWLKEKMGMADLQSFETAVRYQMYHALAILILVVLPNRFDNRFAQWAFHAFWAGIALFSGSIYLLALQETIGFSMKWLGPVTPIGGILFIAGWGLLFYAGVQAMKKEEEED